MTIVEVEQPISPSARGRLVRLPYFRYQVQVLSYSYMFLLLIIKPSTMYLSISPLQGTSRKHWWWTWLCLPKHEISRNSNFHISMLVCYSLANHEPSTMYLSNTLLQEIILGYRSRGSIGGFLKTSIPVLWTSKGRKKVFDTKRIKGISLVLTFLSISFFPLCLI